MRQFDDINLKLSRYFYKPGSEIKIYKDVQKMGINAHFRHFVTDVNDPHRLKTITVESIAYIPQPTLSQLIVDDGFMDNWVRHNWTQLEMHEVDEWLMCAGRGQIFDPHKKP